eukprot:CAMPEP_0170193756 /NCGR_PEP_ID=MMETSP0040_2-20121228/57657_1 /TAXON_ID=641309 /ORGANISM="Lotharella oceanica, Strain CCMP622" /LENGTH=42 /DNA_ID= /DNA_START= /DNA_END= /DNA_ORIENTATION=
MTCSCRTLFSSSPPLGGRGVPRALRVRLGGAGFKGVGFPDRT